MTEPTALRLATMLDEYFMLEARECAAELRRLAESEQRLKLENEGLRATLAHIRATVPGLADDVGAEMVAASGPLDSQKHVDAARAALITALEDQP